jgi:hypothetical protein
VRKSTQNSSKIWHIPSKNATFVKKMWFFVGKAKRFCDLLCKDTTFLLPLWCFLFKKCCVVLFVVFSDDRKKALAWFKKILGTKV